MEENTVPQGEAIKAANTAEGPTAVTLAENMATEVESKVPETTPDPQLSEIEKPVQDKPTTVVGTQYPLQ